MQNHDKEILEGLEKKNDCEAMIYDMMSKIKEIEKQNGFQLQSGEMNKLESYLEKIEKGGIGKSAYMAIIYEIKHNFNPLLQQWNQFKTFKDGIQTLQRAFQKVQILLEKAKGKVIYQNKEKEKLTSQYNHIQSFLLQSEEITKQSNSVYKLNEQIIANLQNLLAQYKVYLN